jgi:hypothetical protein
VTTDPLSSLALTVTLSAAALYALSWAIRRAVARGIRDASGAPERPSGEAHRDG